MGRRSIVRPAACYYAPVASTPVFPVALDLSRRPVLMVGGGVHVERKARELCEVGAPLTVVAREVCPTIASLAARGSLAWYARDFQMQDLAGAGLVILEAQDEALARELWTRRRSAGFLLLALDQPAYCDVWNLATVRRGPVSVSVGSSGQAPALAGKLRRQLEASLDQQFADFAREIAALRASLADLSAAERRAALERALAGFAIEVGVRYPATKGNGAISE